VAGRKRIGAEIPRRLEKVGELDGLVAGHARDRRLAGNIAVGEAVHDLFLEPAFIVQHVMRNADHFRRTARVVDVDARAAGLGLGNGRAVIVELQCDADDVIPFRLHHGRHDRAVDAAGHGNDDARIFRATGQIKTVSHSKALPEIFPVWRRTGIGPASYGHSQAARQFRGISKSAALYRYVLKKPIATRAGQACFA